MKTKSLIIAALMCCIAFQLSSTEKKGQRVVYMGDSITDAWVKKTPSDFFKKNNIVGRGISGQVTSQMLVRFPRDVLDLKPKYVAILAGTNDIAQNQGLFGQKRSHHLTCI